MRRCRSRHGFAHGNRCRILAARPNREDLPPVPDRIHRRWDRFVRLMGHEGVLRLLNSHVTIFGLGGVGSYVAEALARSAVGRMTLVDFDDVCLTNVNRQLQAFPGTVGQSKAVLLAERVRAIHPEAWVDPVQSFYDASTSAALLTPRPDFVDGCHRQRDVKGTVAGNVSVAGHSLSSASLVPVRDWIRRRFELMI